MAEGKSVQRRGSETPSCPSERPERRQLVVTPREGLGPVARHRGCTATVSLSEGSGMSKRLTRAIFALAVVSLTIGVAAVAGAQGRSNEFRATMNGKNDHT